MYTISTSIYGATILGAETSNPSDVDVVIIYAQDPALQLLNSQSGILKTDIKKGIHLHYFEIGELAGKICDGSSYAFISAINPYVIATSPWQIMLDNILKSNLTMLFADELVKYCEQLIEKEKELRVTEPYTYSSLTYLNFGLGYYHSELNARRELLLQPPKEECTREQIKDKLDELKRRIEGAKELTYPTDDGKDKFVYDDEQFISQIQKWVITTRQMLLKNSEIYQ